MFARSWTGLFLFSLVFTCLLGIAVCSVGASDIYGYNMSTNQEFPICTASKTQRDPAVSGDTVVWVDSRNTDWAYNFAIYGYSLSTNQEFLTNVPEGDYTNRLSISGNVVVWESANASGGGLDWGSIYGYDLSLQQIFPIGVEYGLYQMSPNVSGNIVVWANESTDRGSYDIRGRNLSTAQTFSICTDPGYQFYPAISGNIVVWVDWRNDPDGLSGGNSDIYGYDLATGQEFPICTDPGYQFYPAISDNIVVWQDWRNDPDGLSGGNSDIYGYDLATGQEFPICTEPTGQWAPAVSGNIVVWVDTRNGDGDIYGYNLLTGEEFPICTESHNQWEPDISGNIVVWTDERPFIPTTLLRGNLHSHSDFSDAWRVGLWIPSAANIFSEYAPNVYLGVSEGPNVWALTDHYPSLDSFNWVTIGNLAHNQGGLIGLRGFEWSPDYVPFSRPHINVIESDELLKSDETPMLSETDLLTWIASNEAIGQFNHPSTSDGDNEYYWDIKPLNAYNLSGVNLAAIDSRMALFEVGSGVYGLKKIPWPSGWKLDDLNDFKVPYTVSLNPYIKALVAGWHVGATNNQDNHFYTRDRLGTWKGTANSTGIWVKDATREGVMEALKQRWVFASEDDGFRLALTATDTNGTHFMGKQGVAAGSDGKLHLHLKASDDNESIGGVWVLSGEINTGNNWADVFSTKPYWVDWVVYSEYISGREYDKDLPAIEFQPNHWYFIVVKQISQRKFSAGRRSWLLNNGDFIVSSPIWTGD